VIKDLFGWDDGVIYHALQVAETFTLEEIESLVQMRSPLGKPLSYGCHPAIRTEQGKNEAAVAVFRVGVVSEDLEKEALLTTKKVVCTRTTRSWYPSRERQPP